MNDFDLSIILPAFFAGLLVLSTHVPLGMKVLERGIIFADIAVAQIAGLGVIIAGHTDNQLYIQLFAVVSALCGAGLLTLLERLQPEIREASIGLLFVLAATGGILLLSHDVHSGEHLQDLLVGQILWANQTQLIIASVLSALILILLRLFGKKLGSAGFYSLFALAVTASVQMVGIYLVFASLIIPAIASYKLKRLRLPLAYLVGILGYAAGLLASVWWDLPSGAAIVWCMAASGASLLLILRVKKI